MPRGRAEPTRAQISHGLEYVANKPAFLQNFGAPAASSASPGARGTGRGGREPLPERPGDGEWAKGSDDDDDESEEEDEWDQRFGGGDDGPQVVVLKEGRHLTAAEVERERMIAKGIDPDAEAKAAAAKERADRAKERDRANVKTAQKKRKLVGEAAVAEDKGDSKGDADGDKKKKKKKKKAAKGLLSFDEAEGEE